MNILELKKINFSYNELPFIESLNMTLSEGELVGVFGSNGSGKTTLLKLASGLLKQAGGEVSLWDKNLHDYESADRAKLISYLPQVLTAGVPFTVSEVVSMGYYPFSTLVNDFFNNAEAKGGLPETTPETTLDEALDRVGLTGKKDNYLVELSGGELRRVFIAMTLLQGARIVLLDEPFANLDIKYQMEVLTLLKGLVSEKNFSIVMAVHDLNLARQFERLLFLKDGSIIAEGPPDEVITPELLSRVYDIDLDLAKSVHPIDPARP